MFYRITRTPHNFYITEGLVQTRTKRSKHTPVTYFHVELSRLLCLLVTSIYSFVKYKDLLFHWNFVRRKSGFCY